MLKFNRVLLAAGASLLLAVGSVTALAAASPADADKEPAGQEIPLSIDIVANEDGNVNFRWDAESARDFLDRYGKYGVTYNEDTGRLMYGGREIVFFIDGEKDGRLHFSFSAPDSDAKDTVRLAAERDDDGNLTGLKEVTEDEVRFLTEQTGSGETAFWETENGTIVAELAEDSEGDVYENEEAVDCVVAEGGTDFQLDDALSKEYAKFDITVDKNGDVFYQGKPAGFFGDEFYCYANSGYEAPLLKAERDGSGKMTGVRELTAQEIESEYGLIFTVDDGKFAVNDETAF